MSRSVLILSIALGLVIPLSVQQQSADYPNRVIYFFAIDRFNPHHTYGPYVDSAYPGATNVVNCFGHEGNPVPHDHQGSSPRSRSPLLFAESSAPTEARGRAMEEYI